jgi:VCBS repeat-containing protein
LDNDSDPNVGDTLTVTSVDTSGTTGTVIDLGAGSFTYDPDGQFEYLQAGSSTTDSFNYTVSDGHGGTDTATVTITINGVNDPPVAVSDSGTTPEDTPITIDVLDNDSDIDGGTLMIDSVTNGTNGSVTNHGSDVTYTPDLDFDGTDSFTYTISDGNGGTDTATVTVTVIDDETLAMINVQIDTGPVASIYIWDNTDGVWATDEDTGLAVNGTNHVTSGPTHNPRVAGGHSYCVWVGAATVTYDVNSCPSGWSTSPLAGGGEKACGTAVAGSTHSVHFTETES